MKILNCSKRAITNFSPRWPAAVLGLAAALSATEARAAFHLWAIREIYSDSSGTRQFIELFCPSSGQTFVNGMQITVSSGATSHPFTLNHGFSGDSLNHTLLFGTVSLQAAGAPAPDYIIPDNFLFLGSGTISFFGANSGGYTGLPSDGVLSKTWGDGNAPNTPQNFAGQVGVVVVPEPGSLIVLAAAGFGLLCLVRRRV